MLHPGSAQNETIQPSPQDGGQDPQDWVGREYLYTYDRVDAAISKIDAGAVARIIGLPTPNSMADAEEGLAVAKSGRTTGVTHGTVIDDGLEVNQPQWGTSSGPVRFRHVLLARNKHHDFVVPGDSGSLLIDPVEETAVGLVFGRSLIGGNSRGLACPIRAVMRAFPQQILVKPGESYP